MHPADLKWKDATGRRVFYLDQCILSQLAKGRKGLLREPHRSAVQRLAHALSLAVSTRQTAIAVESNVHRLESSELDSGPLTLEDVWTELTVLSRGLQFTSVLETLRSQALLLAAQYDQLPTAIIPPWRTGLSRDPNRSNKETGVLEGAFVVGAVWRPLPNDALLDVSAIEQERSRGDFGTFDVELERCRSGLRKTALKNHADHGWESCWSSHPRERPQRRTVDKVLAEDLFDLPCADAKAKLTASLLAEPHRKFQRGDVLDINFASRAIGYCHMMMVDSNLAERIRQCRLHSAYDATVFGATLDQYEAAAQWLEGLDIAEQPSNKALQPADNPGRFAPPGDRR